MANAYWPTFPDRPPVGGIRIEHLCMNIDEALLNNLHKVRMTQNVCSIYTGYRYCRYFDVDVAVAKLWISVSQVVDLIPIRDKYLYELKMFVPDLDVCLCDIFLCNTLL